MEFTGERYVPCKETENQPIEREHWQRYYFAQSLFDKSAKVLDIASGEGYGSDYLAQKLKYVIGIDISEEAVAYSSEKYRRDNLRFLVGDVSKIPLEDCSVDGIVSFETIEHVDEQAQIEFLEESKRVLKQNGIFVLSCPNKKIASDFAYELWGYTNIYHKKEYEIDSFECLLKKYYTNVKLLYQRTETNLILSSMHPKDLQVIWGDKKNNNDTQNIIAVCSDAPILETVSNLITLDIDNSYLRFQKNYSDIFKANTENIKALSDLQSQLMELHSNAERLETDLKQSKNQIDVYKNQIDVYKNQNATLKDQNAALKGQNTEQHEKLLLLKTQINKSEQKINVQEQKITSLEVHLDKKSEIINLQCQIIGQMENEKSELQTELERRMKQLELMENSKSWKLTKPLRFLANMFRSLLK